MPSHHHLLIDAHQSVVRDGVVYTGNSGAEVRIKTLRGGRAEGVQVIEVDNGHMCIDVLPTRGMGIWRVRRNAPLPRREGPGEGSILGWQAPARDPVHPAFVPLMEPSGFGWLDGFNELLCRCGLESNGPPEWDEQGRLLRPLHGRIANTPAHHAELLVDENTGRIELRGVVDESRFHFQSLRLTSSLKTSIGSNSFSWQDEVQNIGGREASMQMLYHFNIGQPLLLQRAKITTPLGTVAPLSQVAADAGIDTWNIMPPPTPNSAEQVFVLDPAADENGNTRVLVSGLANDQAVSLQFNKRALPCLTIWRNTPAEADGYVLGIEPGTNFPNPRSFEHQHGRMVTLSAGEKWQAEVRTTWHSNSQSSSADESAIRALQNDHEPLLSARPRDGWSRP